ncbi:hypothetical protein K435DRAFT_718226 [Dendrothele bispora CBS 962.96]|uniref:Uncharacterized protein n=1 Tax=Dendrothele bispora (strain CBS 962.96) TaxID=1314807 RepID=A0A4S8MF76_DENBC|nr:hypothetical protein K435DRAFT_718226 [Dendrothele bispora CBS 962.96]
MPKVTRSSSRASAAASSSSQPISQKLRAVTPEELESWSDSDMSDSSYGDGLVDDLDEAYPYTFHTGDSVWVRTAGGNWHQGRVSGETTRKGQTREREGLFYPVKFDGKIRKYFAPLNGEIKPDTPHTRRLLKEAGWDI